MLYEDILRQAHAAEAESLMVLSFCTGAHPEDAFVHTNPSCLPGRLVGSEVQPCLSGPALRPHPDHPAPYVDDWTPLHCQGDEMREC